MAKKRLAPPIKINTSEEEAALRHAGKRIVRFST